MQIRQAANQILNNFLKRKNETLKENPDHCSHHYSHPVDHCIVRKKRIFHKTGNNNQQITKGRFQLCEVFEKPGLLQ